MIAAAVAARLSLAADNAAASAASPPSTAESAPLSFALASSIAALASFLLFSATPQWHLPWFGKAGALGDERSDAATLVAAIESHERPLARGSLAK